MATLPCVVHRDESAGAAEFAHFCDHRFRRFFYRQVLVIHQCGDVIRDHASDEILAVAGAGDGAALIVRVSARADDR